MAPIVFVCGATGTQGGALAHHLLEAGIEVHAVTRNINSAAAQKLQSRGAILTEGDFDNEETLKKSMTDCSSVFLNLAPDFTNPNAELEQARRIISIAKQVGIKQIIHSSGLGTDQPERLQHWNPTGPMAPLMLTKQSVVNEVQNAGFEHWTVLRPGNFMSNFLNPLVQMYAGLVETGKFITVFKRDTKLPMVDPNDIGKFAAAAVLDPQRFNQNEIAFASQLMGVEDILQDLSQATGREIQPVFLTDEEFKVEAPRNPLLGFQLLLIDASQFVDMEKVNSWNIDLGTFPQFLEREKERVQETYL